MRSAVLCVFFALIAHKESRAATEDDFRPTPIPLKDWRPVKQGAAGTLHEIIKTDTPPTIAALPAHYWEDALRHSVYLTLVRDKIDQLIAKDNPNGLSKDVDDHDLWEKIKSAPFDRLKDDAAPTGDLSILAKGRLVEENDGFRFAEDEASRNDCSVNNCTKTAKAFWSVKRVRQRDAEPSTGKYHYELTFSVTSQTPQKLKPFENPVRTFTVKENAPIEPPPVYRQYESFHRRPSRPQRAIWVHKNIAPAHNYRARQSTSDLDRIFTSFFSDEDSNEAHQHRYKPNTHISQKYPQYSKVGYFDNRETYHQKKMIPFPAQTPYKYSRPSFQLHSSPPYIQQSYFNVDPYVNNPHADDAFVPNVVKTTRPAVLPTPVAPSSLTKDSTVEVPVKTLFNKTDYTTKPTEAISTYKMYKPKQSTTKISYSHEHVRPPVYNAPPGVFVTMDKKPFKPMPPMKLVHTSQPVKRPPLDFRPSPPVLDTQFSNPDSAPDAAFRPITITSNEDVYNKKMIMESKIRNKDIRKPSPSKKPSKKEDRIKTQRITTVAPEIITARDDDDIDMEWTTLLGAFSKTTPMASQKATTTESTTVAATTTASVTPAQTEPEETKLEYTLTTPITTSTTPMPKKRTRPPPVFKQEKKVKKHKRITTTTTSTTTTEPPRKFTVPNPTEDLTPQASSAPTSGANSVWEARNKTESIKLTTSTNTKVTFTTSRPTTTTYLTTSSTTLNTTVETKPTTRPRSKDRFRQSTFMQKGTSVTHDKWFLPTVENNRTTTLSERLYKRRKFSKFHGHNSSTTHRMVDEEKNNEYHEDHVVNANSGINSTESYKDDNTDNTITPSTQTSIDEYVENNDTTTDSANETEKEDSKYKEDKEENDKGNDERVFNDDREFIFQIKSTTAENVADSDTSDNALRMEPTTVTSQPLAAKNKTKCKKKKHNNLSTTEAIPETSSAVFVTTMTSTEKVTTPDMGYSLSSTPDILEELLGGFTMDADENDEPKPSTADPDSEGSQSIKHERYIGDDSVDRFLESLEVKGTHRVNSDEQTENDYYESSDISIEDNPFDNADDEDSNSREAHYDEYYEDDESQGSRPYSLLELMAME